MNFGFTKRERLSSVKCMEVQVLVVLIVLF